MWKDGIEALVSSYARARFEVVTMTTYLVFGLHAWELSSVNALLNRNRISTERVGSSIGRHIESAMGSRALKDGEAINSFNINSWSQCTDIARKKLFWLSVHAIRSVVGRAKPIITEITV
jgi:hypothetical protein